MDATPHVGDALTRLSLGAVVLAAASLAPTIAGADSFTLIVSGASGGAEYEERYDRWRAELVTALRAQSGFREDHLVVLAETERDGVGRASEEGVRSAFETLSRRMDEKSTLLVVLLGHGTYDGTDAKFNLVGPDLTASEWGSLTDTVPGRLVFVNTTAASFPFLESIAGDGRVVITATVSAAQRYDTVFAEFLTRALVDPSADLDKNGRLAAWEMFAFASEAVRRWYQQQGRLATERPLLDDTGDGHGVTAEDRGHGGGLASAVHVGAGSDADADSEEAATDPPADATLAALSARRAALEREIAELRASRGSMTPERYATELEQRLLALARVSREIRQYRAGRP